MPQTIENKIPKHVAIIMDGNGRWAKAKMLPRLMGHHRGLESARTAIRTCSDAGVQSLTLFAFSSENWKRPRAEVQGLMSLFMTALEREAANMLRHKICMRFIGERTHFSEKLQHKITEVEQTTRHCQGMNLLIAANYGGRWDILQAFQQLATHIQNNQINVSDINEETLNRYLSTAPLPEPDLFIRTGGEKRISNFLLWQLAYSELYFSDRLWPEFNEQDLQTAFEVYAKRQRRFGMISEQVTQESRKNQNNGCLNA